jgi:hypothetical protein
VSLLVGFSVEAERLLAVRPVGDNRLGAAPFQPLPQFGTVIGLVAKQPDGCLGTADEALGRWAIVRLAAGQQDGKKTAFSICQCMDLRIAPSS